MEDFKGIALITGANRGLGFEISKQLLEKGWKVIATGRNLTDLKQNWKGSETDRLLMFELDVTDSQSIQRLSDMLKAENLVLNVLINNAGLGTGKVDITAPEMNEIREIFDVNFFGVWELTGALIPLFKTEGERCIINISSKMGAHDELRGTHAAYRLSKAALNAYSLALSQALKNKGILVHTVCPGWIKTDMGGENAPGEIDSGASSVVYLAETPALPGGRFWSNRKPTAW